MQARYVLDKLKSKYLIFEVFSYAFVQEDAGPFFHQVSKRLRTLLLKEY